MSESTQYPDGIYKASWGGSMTDVVRLETARDDEQWVQGTRFGGWLRESLLSGMVLTPLVPSTELDAARQRIADLEAEVERLTTDRTVDEMLQDLRHRYGSYVHLSANYNSHWWVAWGVGPQNRTGYYLVPSEAIRAAWEAVCKEPQP